MIRSLLIGRPATATGFGAAMARALSTSAANHSKVAVVLSGSGVFDGSEITEAVSTLVHLSKSNVTYECFAPNINQMHVIDHTSGTPTEETRNVLKESARIARGNIKALSDLKEKNFDAVIFPGGFGAAKNLCSFAVDGPDMSVNEEVKTAIESFAAASKPIGLCCIAPVLAAKLLPGVEVTVGSDKESDEWPYAGTAGGIDAMGGTHVVKSPTEAHVDAKQKVVTSAAYMHEGTPSQVFDSVGAMVSGVLSLLKNE